MKSSEPMRALDRLTGMRIAKSLAAGIAAITLSACASASGSIPGPAGTPAVQPQWTSCVADAPTPTRSGANDALALPRLGTDFTPTAAIVCDARFGQSSDGGQDIVAAESRSDDITALVTALRLPDQRPTGDACAAILVIVPWFALLDAHGQWIRPGVPRDSCGQPRTEVVTAIHALHQTRIATHVINQVESGAAAAAGCSQQYADMVTVETTQGPVSAGAIRSDPFAAGGLRLCIYAVPPSEVGTAKPAGGFDHGLLLPPGRQTAIEQALVGAPAAGTCSTESTRFALLIPEGGAGPTVYVELDGCHRIMVDATAGKPFVAQADQALLTLLNQ